MKVILEIEKEVTSPRDDFEQIIELALDELNGLYEMAKDQGCNVKVMISSSVEN